MHIATKQLTVVRVEATEAEWATIRALVAEGLTVVEAVTPAMARCAEALGLTLASPDPAALAAAPAAPPTRTGSRKGG